MKKTIGLDAAVKLPAEDRYGYDAIAENLARSILSLDHDVTAVIGIEGPWGSGKTSLLNLLLIALKDKASENTFILNISPWLNGDGISPVESLLFPVAAIIEEKEEKLLAPAALMRHKRKKEISMAANSLLNYTKATTRQLAPLAEFSGNFIPGMTLASKGMKAISELELSARKETATVLRSRIEKKIEELDISFIVVLDDLDRLEPAQAVEIIRLVKSVADFPRFKYVMCYDRQVLAHAVEQKLGVSDGSLYLQKILQLTFRLPRPESFDLRREFFSEVQEFYREVNGESLSAESIDDLSRVTDIYGAAFSTPREIRLAVNAIKFLYPGMRDFVYFPDLCLLHLIKILNPALYDWTESYLIERSVVESGDGRISTDEQSVFAEKLNILLQNYRTSDASNPNVFGGYIPGITRDIKSNIRLFSNSSDVDREKWAEQKRLGSDAFYRYYFSFSAPQNVLPPEFFDDLLRQAENDRHRLQQLLMDRINGNGISSRTWFEHILNRFTHQFIANMTYAQCEGMVWFFFNCADNVNDRFLQRNRFFSLQSIAVDGIVSNIIRRMHTVNPSCTLKFLSVQFAECNALFWMTLYMRKLLWDNGVVGDRPKPEADRILDAGELDTLRQLVARRLDQCKVKASILSSANLHGHLYAWQEIASPETVQEWVSDIITNDENFLVLLLRLRDTIYSSGVCFVLYLEKVQVFFVGMDILRRLKDLESNGEFKDKFKELRDAIELAHFF